MKRSLRLTCATAILATLTALPAQAATFKIDMSLGGSDSRTTIHSGQVFSDLRVTGEIETPTTAGETGVVAASDLVRWSFSFFRGEELSPVASISSTDTGASGSGSFAVDGNELLSSGFLLGVWTKANNIQSDTSIRFNTEKKLVIYARQDDLSNNQGVKTFETGFSFFQDTPCETLNLTQPGQVACAAGNLLRIGALANPAQQPTPVPLPAAGLLLLSALAGLGAITRRRKAA